MPKKKKTPTKDDRQQTASDETITSGETTVGGETKSGCKCCDLTFRLHEEFRTTLGKTIELIKKTENVNNEIIKINERIDQLKREMEDENQLSQEYNRCECSLREEEGEIERLNRLIEERNLEINSIRVENEKLQQLLNKPSSRKRPPKFVDLVDDDD